MLHSYPLAIPSFQYSEHTALGQRVTQSLCLPAWQEGSYIPGCVPPDGIVDAESIWALNLDIWVW